MCPHRRSRTSRPQQLHPWSLGEGEKKSVNFRPVWRAMADASTQQRLTQAPVSQLCERTGETRGVRISGNSSGSPHLSWSEAQGRTRTGLTPRPNRQSSAIISSRLFSIPCTRYAEKVVSTPPAIVARGGIMTTNKSPKGR